MKGVRLSVDSSCPGAMLKLVGGGHRRYWWYYMYQIRVRSKSPKAKDNNLRVQGGSLETGGSLIGSL